MIIWRITRGNSCRPSKWWWSCRDGEGL